MRNRFHKEPVNKENVVRPDQAGTKENPDYVVNIAGKNIDKKLGLIALGGPLGSRG